MLGWIGWIVLCLLTLRCYRVSGQGECTDHRGRLIAHGLHYVPGPDTCTLCVCDNGLPKVCKAVLCSPPQDCRSFRVGSTCCEFICLDDVVKPAEATEGNVRVAAGGAAAVVLFTVALVVYRVRRQKRRRPTHADDQRSLTSIGYISGSMGYMGGTCETALAAWKPHGNYLPRGEAPPPYDEAVAQCRQDAIRATTSPPYHRTCAGGGDAPCLGHAYANMPRNMQQLANPAGCYNAPLLQQAEPPHTTTPAHHPLAHNMVGFPSAIRLTGSLGAISNRGLLSLLQREPEPERPHNVPGFYTNAPNLHTSLHRTIPRVSGGLESCGLSGLSGLSGLPAAFPRADAEVRRSFHKPAERAERPERPDRPHAGRSMPRDLHIASQQPSNIRVSASGVNNTNPAGIPALPPAGIGRRDSPDGSEGKSPAPPPHKPPPPGVKPASSAPPQTLPLTVDKPSCVCSYAGAGCAGGGTVGDTGGDGGGAGEEGGDADDYRAECENCKAANNSRWVTEAEWADEADDGTQTLQRRAPPPAPPPTNTLPQPVTKPHRAVMGPPSNWENWFNTIADSDTESEEE